MSQTNITFRQIVELAVSSGNGDINVVCCKSWDNYVES